MEKIDLNNVSLSYETKGKGSDILLLHGFPSNMYMWNEIKNELIENDYRVTIVEQRGYPLSRLENFDVLANETFTVNIVVYNFCMQKCIYEHRCNKV